MKNEIRKKIEFKPASQSAGGEPLGAAARKYVGGISVQAPDGSVLRVNDKMIF